MEHPDKKVA